MASLPLSLERVSVEEVEYVGETLSYYFFKTIWLLNFAAEHSITFSFGEPLLTVKKGQRKPILVNVTVTPSKYQLSRSSNTSMALTYHYNNNNNKKTAMSFIDYQALNTPPFVGKLKTQTQTSVLVFANQLSLCTIKISHLFTHNLRSVCRFTSVYV